MASLDDLPVFIPDFQEFMARGEELVLEQARKCPMARGMFGLELFRRDDVQTALRDRRIEARISLALLAQGVTDGQLFDTLSNSILNINGPEHQRQRSLVGKAFTPASVERIRPAMRDLANELIDEFAPHGEVEFMESFANQYPVQVICTMLGVPRIERHTFRIWLDTISFALSSVAGQKRQEIEAAQIALVDYVENLIARRRTTPGDDLVTALLAVEDGADRFTHEEVVRMIIGLLFAGHDTTRNQLGRTLQLFSHHPVQWAWLADHPEASQQALDECMRFAPSVGSVSPRLTIEEVTIGTVTVPANTIVNANTVAASRDPSIYDDPDTFDIRVVRPVAPLVFGGGPHLCLGINLAKAEMSEALILLSRRMRNLAPNGDPVLPPQVGIFGPITVPLRFTPS